MKAQAKRYDREFKLEAVRLVEESDRPMWKIAEELGVSANTLSAWKKAVHESRELAFPEGGPTRRFCPRSSGCFMRAARLTVRLGFTETCAKRAYPAARLELND